MCIRDRVEGAKDCAVEVCSFSKIAGFTGTRCGYTVVPQAIVSDGPVSYTHLSIATIRQTRKCCNLSWHGGMIAGMITPHRIARCV